MEHRVCLKEGEEQPSPCSTLESPFEEVADLEDEETSTSGCFEKISADLQGKLIVSEISIISFLVPGLKLI
jgi:hypothetical protein